ncbi:MAG: cobyrinate a,c-diamide synthase [Hydrogenoanaerobacterium sp.]
MKNINTPRLMLAAPASGSGKTTLTCAVLQAFVNRGLKASSFKCGPDYIDPMFHTEVIGTLSRNLDLFLFDENTANYLLAKNSQQSDISVLEGAMGFYDGVGGGESASSYHLAKATNTPVVLVLSARGMALSAAALVHGFATFKNDSNIKAVILNNCSKNSYNILKKLIEEQTGVHVAGYMPPLSTCLLESRHLGLVTAGEVQNLRQKLYKLAHQAEETIELDFLLRLAQAAPQLIYTKPALPPSAGGAPLRVAVARDKAFLFYYEDSLELLRELGAELVPFSPIADAELPQGICGLLLGGGYPEIYAKELSQNTRLLVQIKEKLAGGLPCIAECGGFLYLHNVLKDEQGVSFNMVGAVAAEAENAHELRHFGYVTLTAGCDNLLCQKGQKLQGHEFHYWHSTNEGEGFTVQKPFGKAVWQGGYVSKTLYAGFPHMHFYGAPFAAKNFLLQCKLYRMEDEAK